MTGRCAPIWIARAGVAVLLAGAAPAAAMVLARARTARTPARIRARDGRTMMEITSLGVADGQLVIKGSFMGAMPATTLVRPEEAWKVAGLVGMRVIVAMPAYLLVGWWRCVRPTPAAGPS
jgi:hypothetical protein